MKSDAIRAIESEIDGLVEQLTARQKALDLLRGVKKERKKRQPKAEQTEKAEEKKEPEWTPKPKTRKKKEIVNPPLENI